MLKRVHIQGYKSLRDIHIQILPLVCLFGPNGGGKSNFLQALQLLSHIANHADTQAALVASGHRIAAEIFPIPRAGNPTLPECTISLDLEFTPMVREQLQQALHLTADDPQLQNLHMHYSITLQLRRERGDVIVTQETINTFYPGISSKDQPFSFSIQRQEQIMHIQHERGKDPQCTAKQSLLSSGHPLQKRFPYIQALHTEIARWQWHQLEPRIQMRQHFPALDVTHLGQAGEQLTAYLNVLCQQDEVKFNAIEQTLHSIIPSTRGFDISVNDRDEAVLRLIESRQQLSLRGISDGTLRWLGLLLLHGVQYQPTLICLEEPESGLFPTTLRQLISLLKTLAYEGTQIILTTYSPQLLKGFSSKYLYACYKIEGQSFIEPIITWQHEDIKMTSSSPIERRQLMEYVKRSEFAPSEVIPRPVHTPPIKEKEVTN